jgi:mannose-6-phosphate isomerase-like protein (cupin superfamily)
MHVIDNATRLRTSLPGIAHTTLAGADDGLRHLSIWCQSIDPGQASPPHRHDDCEEVVLIESGHGELHIGGTVHPFGPNSTLIIPPGVDHQIFNTGPEPVCLTAVFSVTPVPTVFPDGEPVPLPWRS